MAVIGIGTMGKKYAKMIQEGRISGMCLGAVCCRSHESSQWAKAELGGEIPVFQDTEKLFDASELFDACLIVTPHKLHPEMIIQAFDKGKHIFCDKPIGVSMGQCLKIRQKAEEKDLVFAMMFHQRMYPKYERIHELLESGTLGQIRRILMENSRYYRTWHYHKSGSWRSSWRGEGGGALLNQGQHLLDIWQWLFGMTESLYALIPYGKYNDFSVDDEATIVMKYPDKKTAVFILTTGEGTWTERLEIVGSKGTLLLEDSHLTLHLYDRDLEEYKRTASCNSREELKERVTEETFPQDEEPYEEMLADFAQAVLEKRPVRVNGLEGLNSLELTNAAYLSAWMGAPVSLPIDEVQYERELEKRIREEI